MSVVLVSDFGRGRRKRKGGGGGEVGGGGGRKGRFLGWKRSGDQVSAKVQESFLAPLEAASDCRLGRHNGNNLEISGTQCFI